MPHMEPLDNPTQAEFEAILAPLDSFSRASGFVWKPEGLILVLRDDAGQIVGGAMGETNWGWLHVRILAVAEELRGQGWGSQLMLEMERRAVSRGCHHAWVDTFSFQARPFYEGLGYKVFGTLPDYPIGESRFFLSKTLSVADDSSDFIGKEKRS
ncbi:GNAT family N-acetyltransferase [Isosphaeraceae bacterium EP7]